jgi:hypothetical protein
MIDNGRHKDDDCKILLFGKDVIFTTAGMAHFEVTGPYTAVWDARVAARRVIAKLARPKDTPAEALARTLASSWEKEAVNFFQTVVRHGGENGITTYAGNQIVECIFAVRAVDDTLAVSHALITVDSSTAPTTIKSADSILKPVAIAAIGYGTVLQKYYPHPTTPLARAQEQQWHKSVANKTHEEQLISFIAQLVQWTIDAHLEEIGGDVDEAILDASGARWVRRKSNCVRDSRLGGDTL